MLKVVQRDLLEDPSGENGGKRGAKTGNLNERKNSLALERGRTKHNERSPVLQGTGNLTKGMKSLNGCAGCQVPQLVDALLSMKMKVGETLRNYASRYWELYNKIGGGNEKIAASTLRMGLPEDFELRESLTKKSPKDMRQLMRRIEEYKRLEGGFQPRNRKDLKVQEPEWQLREVNVAFKEPVHRIIDRIKNELYFRWPNKMGGDPSQRNQNMYCTYHKDKGHTTEQCRVLKHHLEQLVKAGHLKEFVVNLGDWGTGQGVQQRGNPFPPSLGVIEVIHAAPRSTTVTESGVLTVVPVEDFSDKKPPEKKAKSVHGALAFDDDDLEGTIQPYDDALVVIAWVGSFMVKRVMID
ncbi:uncharacterized protein LOC136066474 [Quercus suber]|uniref:uncharacterized protein LOC136066474 n=1 Tax=Quercus suber TaxID=58331 RepID=UPI0032DF9E81